MEKIQKNYKSKRYLDKIKSAQNDISPKELNLEESLKKFMVMSNHRQTWISASFFLTDRMTSYFEAEERASILRNICSNTYNSLGSLPRRLHSLVLQWITAQTRTLVVPDDSDIHFPEREIINRFRDRKWEADHPEIIKQLPEDSAPKKEFREQKTREYFNRLRDKQEAEKLMENYFGDF